jgi:hypothetical protein
LVIFTAEPGQTARLPLLVGTWQLTASLRLADGRRLRTPLLELTITG